MIDGALGPRLEIEPVLTVACQSHPMDSYRRRRRGRRRKLQTYVTRDPAGTIIAPAPGYAWPAPLRPYGSFALTYTAGFVVTPETAPPRGGRCERGTRKRAAHGHAGR